MKKPAKQSPGRVDQLIALHDLTLQITEARSTDEFMSAAISQIVGAVAPDLIFFFLLENNELILKKSWQQPDGESSIVHELKEIGVCLCGLAAAEEKPVYSINIHKDARCTLKECKLAGVQSFAAVPLLSTRGKVMGLICIGSFTRRNFKKDANFIEILCSHVAIALSHMLIIEELQHEKNMLLVAEENERISRSEVNRHLSMLYSFLDATTDAVFIKDTEGRYLMANHATAAFVGRPVEEIIGHDDYHLFPPSDAEFLKKRDRSIMESASVDTSEENLQIHGETRTFLATKGAVRDTEGNVIGLFGISRDITKRKYAEEKIRQLNRVYSIMSNINKAIVRLRKKQQLFEEICRIAVEDGEFRMAWIGEADENTEMIRVVASFGSTGGYLDSIRISTRDIPEGRGPSGRAFRTGRHVISSDIEHDEKMRPWRDNAIRNGYRASASLPITVSGRTIGTFNLYSSTVGFFNDDEVRLLDELADDISYALQFITAEENIEKARQVIAQSLQQQKAILNSIPDIAWLKDLESRFIAVNEPFGSACGRKADELVGRSDWDVWPTELAERYRADDQEVIKSGRRRIVEEPLVDAEGVTTWLETIKTPIFDDKGHIIGTSGIARDITERKRMENALRESRDKAQMYFNLADVMLCVLTKQGRVELINPKGCEILGYAMTEIIGNDWFEHCLPERIRTEIKTVFHSLMKGDIAAVEYYENPVLTKEGNEKVIAFHNTIIRDSDGMPTSVLFSGEDITERLLAQHLLQEEEERLRAIFESTNEGILMADPATKTFYYGNRMICQMLGYSLEEIKSLGIMNIHPEKDLPYVLQQFDRQARGELKLAENIPVKRRDGTIFYADVNASPLTLGEKTFIAGFFSDITERKKVQEVLKEKEYLLSESQRIAHIGTWALELATGRLTWTDETYHIYGCSKDTFVPSIDSLLGLLHPEDKTLMNEWIEACLAGNNPDDLEFRAVLAGGNIRFLSGRGTLQYDTDGIPFQMVGTVQDVTDQKLIKSSLEEQRRFAEGIIENSTVATFVLNVDHNIVLWNKACEELTGMLAEEMIGSDNQWKPFYPDKRHTLCDIVIEGNFSDLSSLFKKYSSSPLIANGLRAEGWFPNLNGKERYIVFDAAPIFGADDKLICAIETLQDLTMQYQSEKALKNNLLFLQRLIDSIPNPIFYKDREGRYIGCNRAFEEYLGRRQDDLIGKTVFEIAPRDLAEVYHKADEQLFMNPGTQTYEASVQYADGSMHDVIFYKATFDSSDGSIGGLIGTIMDITDRKKLENSLAESKERLKTIINTEPHCVKLVSRDGSLIEMNPAGLAMIEADSLEQVTGQSLLSVIAPGHKKTFLAHVAMVFRGESETLDFEIIGLKGAHRWLSTHSVPFRDSKGEVIALLGIARDITEQRKLEEQLRHAQKLEGIGQLAGGIAHDFNNILNAVIGFGSLAQMNIDSPALLKGFLTEVIAAGQRGASLTQQLLAFSRKQTLDMKQVNINVLINNLLKLLQRLIREDVKLSFMPSAYDLFVMADGSQIDQVIINLTTNARDAIQHSGAITITSQSFYMGKEFIDMHGFGADGQYALISIADTGSGMDRQTMDRIFEPFFTTKESGKGTGLGLAVVYGIIRQHSGFIDIHSEPGTGSIFRIYLPLTTPAVNSEKEIEVMMPAGGTEAILIADDDKSVRNLLHTLLTQAGYTVITAEDGADAVKKFRERRGFIDLVILDAIMPKKNGKEAFTEISAITPGIKTIFLSGYATDIIDRQEMADREIPFLSKPILPNDLLRKIREVLDM